MIEDSLSTLMFDEIHTATISEFSWQAAILQSPADAAR